MTIYSINKTTYAIGASNQIAKYVVRANGKKVTGVRGRRPLLDKRFAKATGVRKDVAEALRAGAAA